MTSLSDQIESTAAAPKSMTQDGETAVAHSLQDLIAADKHLASKAAVRRRNRGLLYTKFEPPGTAE